MTLFWHGTGPEIEYAHGAFRVLDLNPQNEMQWRMSKAELFKLGWKCLRAALSRK